MNPPLRAITYSNPLNARFCWCGSDTIVLSWAPCSDCVRPIGEALWACHFARADFVMSTVGELESSNSEAVNDMVDITDGIVISIEADGKAVSAWSRNLYWTPTPPAGITRAFGEYTFAAPSAAAYAIQTTDSFMALSKPFVAVLPQALLDIIAAEPAGVVARSYRLYVRIVLMPVCRRVADILNTHQAVVREPPAPTCPSSSDADPSTSTNTAYNCGCCCHSCHLCKLSD